MTRNGGIAQTFRAALLKRIAPATGISLKMLAHQLQRAGTPISTDTLERYRDDTTTIAGAAIQAIDAALAHFGFPGFMAEVYGRSPAAGSAAAVPSSESPSGILGASAADTCLWATHEGTLHKAERGHADFARRYLDLPHDTAADAARFAINQLGWLKLTHYADGRLLLDGDAARNAEARDRVASWLEGQGSLLVSGPALPKAMSATDAAAWLRDQLPVSPITSWTATPIDAGDLTETPHRDLWRAIHDAGIERAHLVELAGRTGMLDRAALFLVDGRDVTSASVGTGLPINRSVVGRNVMARQDQVYASQLRRDVLATVQAGASITRLRRHNAQGIEGGYDRAAFAQRTGPNRWLVLSASSGLLLPPNFQALN